MASGLLNEPVRLLAVTGCPPCSAGGGGLMLRKLLGGYPADKLTIFTNGRAIDDLAEYYGADCLLDVPYIRVRPWRSNIPGVRRLLRSLNSLRILPAAARLARLASTGTAILAVPWGGEFGSELFVAAYLAHRWSGAPLVVYEMDEWGAAVRQAGGAIARMLEKHLHSRIIREAQTVWVISREIAKEFQSRFNVEPRILEHGVDLQGFLSRRRKELAQGGPTRADERRLLYTGSIYGAQIGAVRNVLKAIQSQPKRQWSLVIYTSQQPSTLTSQGIEGPGLRIEPAVPVEAMPDILATADALLLPFSFEEKERSVVSTSLPSKIADYLASGVPVLVHAPPYATVTSLASEEGWALVVSEESTEQLNEALGRLASDKALRDEMAKRALSLAHSRHDLVKCREAFVASIQQAVAASA
ncbi:MAG: glycosyltransferase [Acidobacteriota bacterium]|nr:glycosyltransferase [Acidobacteriota bacterium]